MGSRKNRRWEDVDKGKTSIEELARYYDIYNRSDGKAPATLRWYQRTLALFGDWLAKTGRPTTLDGIDELVVREHVLWLQARQVRGRPIRTYSVNNRVRALRAFFNWLYRQGYTKTHLLQNLKPPRLPKLIVDTLSDEEIAAIMASLDRSTVAGSRDTAILALFLDSGLRLSELASLTVANVNIDDQYVKVVGKGAKERMVSFGSATKRALVDYVVRFRGEPAHAGIEVFFLSIDGYPLAGEAVKTMLRRVGAKSGVPRLHAHLCRHTYATNFLVNGGNVLLLKQNLGHTTLAMVDRYVHLATSRVAVLSREFSPLDRLNLKGFRHGPRAAGSEVTVFRHHKRTRAKPGTSKKA